MKCVECGSDIESKFGLLELEDDYVGAYSVDSVHYQECRQCGEKYFPHPTAAALDTKWSEVEQALIRSHPLNDFLTAAETSAVLAMTRQALQKHRRIRRGFIYQTSFGGKTVYLRESVLRFKETGDGRFRLRQTEKPLLLVEGTEEPRQIERPAHKVRMVAEARARYKARRKNA